MKSQNSIRFERWRLKHPEQHRANVRHYRRIALGFYDRLEQKIAYYQEQLKGNKDGTLELGQANKYIRVQRNYYQKLPAKIKKLERILEVYKKGEVPNE